MHTHTQRHSQEFPPLLCSNPWQKTSQCQLSSGMSDPNTSNDHLQRYQQYRMPCAWCQRGLLGDCRSTSSILRWKEWFHRFANRISVILGVAQNRPLPHPPSLTKLTPCGRDSVVGARGKVNGNRDVRGCYRRWDRASLARWHRLGAAVPRVPVV